ncbi:MAG TPA: hypothetical protein DHW82_13260 [Spirochaetia bacterium]|nr:MAG: hypothetical protein A2Y41_12340 [Spirochaetes bacterium GWB1_36_13]HCL57958.1 hypothetical protein [Spirochaetia bacterium]
MKKGILAMTAVNAALGVLFYFKPLPAENLKVQTENRVEEAAKAEKIVKKIIEYEDRVKVIEEIQREKKMVYKELVEILNIKETKYEQYTYDVEVKNEDILEEIPGEMPAWVIKPPTDTRKKNLYIVGTCEIDTRMEECIKKAETDSTVQIGLYIKKQVDYTMKNLSVSVGSEKTSQMMIRRILEKSKNTFMREKKTVEKYYKKIKSTEKIPFIHYQASVLVSYPLKNVDAAIREGLEYEKEAALSNTTDEKLKKEIESLKISEEKLVKAEQDKKAFDSVNEERSLLLNKYKSENLYHQGTEAERLEKAGKVKLAYDMYQNISAHLKIILKTEAK